MIMNKKTPVTAITGVKEKDYAKQSESIVTQIKIDVNEAIVCSARLMADTPEEFDYIVDILTKYEAMKSVYEREF